jgi:hypothetical protein
MNTVNRSNRYRAVWFFQVATILAAVVMVGCAHSTGERALAPGATSIYVVGVNYALKVFRGRPPASDEVLCLEIDGQSPPTSVLQALDQQGMTISGNKQDCLLSKGRGVIVVLGGLKMNEDRATLRVGVFMQQGGTIELTRVDGDWRFKAVYETWIACSRGSGFARSC